MHMKENYMRNAQLRPGYDVQIAMDSEYIVATDIFQDRNEVWTFVPFLKNGRKTWIPLSSVTEDSGYEREEGYSYLRKQKYKPYIKLQTYEKRRGGDLKSISVNVKRWVMMKVQMPYLPYR